MIIRALSLFLALFVNCLPLQGGVWDNVTSYFGGSAARTPPTIRVLLIHDAEKVDLQVRGKYSLFDPYTNSYISSRFAGKSRTIQAVGDGLKWGESFPGLYQLKIQPKDKSTVTSINGHDFESLLYVYDIGGTISIVNEVPVENYVKSVLLNYQNQDLEPELLTACAIVIRTNAYFQAVNPKNTYWAVDAQKVGFQGLADVSPAIDRAVTQTQYMIMSRTGIYEGAATPFNGQFGTFSGGHVTKEAEVSKITLEEANAMAKKGEHAAQILSKAFPGSTIMLMKYSE